MTFEQIEQKAEAEMEKLGLSSKGFTKLELMAFKLGYQLGFSEAQLVELDKQIETMNREI